MEEGEPGEDRNTLKDNSMTIMILSEKGGHGTSLFLFVWFLELTKQTQ
jgi:hypothetical protein